MPSPTIAIPAERAPREQRVQRNQRFEVGMGLVRERSPPGSKALASGDPSTWPTRRSRGSSAGGSLQVPLRKAPSDSRSTSPTQVVDRTSEARAVSSWIPSPTAPKGASIVTTASRRHRRRAGDRRRRARRPVPPRPAVAAVAAADLAPGFRDATEATTGSPCARVCASMCRSSLIGTSKDQVVRARRVAQESSARRPRVTSRSSRRCRRRTGARPRQRRCRAAARS